jgi:hypothetical protein
MPLFLGAAIVSIGTIAAHPNSDLPCHSLKEVMPVGTIKLATEHATVLEIYVPIGTGTGRYGPAFPGVPCRRRLRDSPV